MSEGNDIMDFIEKITNRSEEEVKRDMDESEKELFELLKKGIKPDDLVSPYPEPCDFTGYKRRSRMR